MVSYPLIDLEFGHTEVHVIPLMQGGFGGEQCHRILTLPRAQEVGLACRQAHPQTPPERHALRRSSVQPPAYSQERYVSEGNSARIS